MGRKKLIHMQDIAKKDNAFDSPVELKGKWHTYFKSKELIVLEIGCGYGQYTIGLAKKFKDKNFIGMDRKGDRVWNAANIAKESELKNVGFISGNGEKLDEYFEKGEISEIWVTFPDPYPKPSKNKRILTSSRFLEVYRKVASNEAIIHLKTDNEHVFEYTKETIKNEELEIVDEQVDIHSEQNEKNLSELLKITTYYEAKFIKEKKPIFYVAFKLFSN